MSNWNPDSFSKAWNFATLYHQGQTYGGALKGQKIPYINHIGSVGVEVIWALSTAPELDGDLRSSCGRVSRPCNEPKQAIQCALLHDTIEDTEATYDLVVENFGRAVADGVMALTKDSTLPSKAEQMADSLRRIQQQPLEIWMVKMADRIINLHHPPYYWKPEKIESYRQEATSIYNALHSANLALANRLKEKIDLYQSFAGVN
jgi:(p)ppGpp synthase/HD superfamily hydrolase